MIGLPLFVRVRCGATENQLELVSVRGIAVLGECAQARVDGTNDRPDTGIARDGQSPIGSDAADSAMNERDCGLGAAKRQSFDYLHNLGQYSPRAAVSSPEALQAIGRRDSAILRGPACQCSHWHS